MSYALDIILLVIVIWSIFSGIRQGVVNKTIALIGLIVALVGGSIISSTFSGTLNPAFEPFASGLAESAEKNAIKDMGYENTEYSLNDIVAADEDIRDDYCVALYEELGLSEDRAVALAESAVKLSDTKSLDIQSAAVEILSTDILYMLGTVLCSIIIFIILAAVSNLINLTFHVPGKTFETVGGVVVGLVEGLLIYIIILWVLSFLGSLIGKSTIDSTLVSKYLLNFTNIFDIML